MNTITKRQYEFALAKIEELLPAIDDNTPANEEKAIELSVMSDIVIIAYEKEYYSISKPAISEVNHFTQTLPDLFFPSAK